MYEGGEYAEDCDNNALIIVAVATITPDQLTVATALHGLKLCTFQCSTSCLLHIFENQPFIRPNVHNVSIIESPTVYHQFLLLN